MTVTQWLEANRHRLQGEPEEWVTQRVAVLEIPGRTLTVGPELSPPEGHEPVLNSCVVELGVEEGKPVLSRVTEDPRQVEAEARRLIA
jgi:hypothetical protein